MLENKHIDKQLEQHLLFTQKQMQDVLTAAISVHTGADETLQNAIAYVLHSGGKRLRAAIVYAAAQALKLDAKIADHIACAIEMIHAASLIHDDLPALDDDNIRRGQPACHVKFSEAIAVLAGDALITMSQQILCHIPTEIVPAERLLFMVQHFQHIIGQQGMMAGVAKEFSQTTQLPTYEQLMDLYALKTGGLFAAGLQLPLIALAHPNATDEQLFSDLSKHLGIIFQLSDDLLDINGDPELIGKPLHSDNKNNHYTLLRLLGNEQAQEELSYHLFITHEYIDSLNDNFQLLHKLIDYFVFRKY